MLRVETRSEGLSHYVKEMYHDGQDSGDITRVCTPYPPPPYHSYKGIASSVSAPALEC